MWQSGELLVANINDEEVVMKHGGWKIRVRGVRNLFVIFIGVIKIL